MFLRRGLVGRLWRLGKGEGGLIFACVKCRIMGECQAAVATCIEVFGRIDVVFECCSESGFIYSIYKMCVYRALVADKLWG